VFNENPENKPAQMELSRRNFLKTAFGASAALSMPTAFADVLKQPERKLSFLNLHTGEKLSATYWAEGQYQMGELDSINHLLRDHRTGDVEAMDRDLIDMLNLLHHKMDSTQPFHVISGYRSPKTNEKLRNTTSGVAKKSYHMQGRAVDILLPDREIVQLRKAAVDLEMGGVGLYSKSGFIHLDTGNVRQWGV